VAEVRPSRGTRALVLGGGGVTGIAWEVGVLAALRASGVDLGRSDAVIGSSAGAFVGAALASGYEPSDTEPRVAATPQTWAAWAGAFAAGGDDPRKVGAALGQVSRATAAGVPPAERQAVVRARLVTTQWPHSLQVTAIDADTGQLHVFDAASGVSLLDAASASGAVPGIWPLVVINGRSWLDGGMVSTTNARLAEGYERVVVLAPMPVALGAIPGAAQDLAVLSEHAHTLLIAPDDACVAAIGPNPYDPDRRGPAAAAGRAQGTALAETVRAIW